ncbi:MAG: hypothetical protein KAT48_02165 [Bacteroidales bacterium]|nr:hypothetical protein [Bacteroidales bacterium]
MKNFVLFVYLCIVCFGSGAFGQTGKYDIIVGGHKVGEFTTGKIEKGDTIVYKLQSKASVHLFVETTITYHLTSIYVKEKLIESTNKTYKNGDLHSSTTVKWSNGQYTIIKNGHTTTLDSPITFTSAALYFSEPSGVNRVFSESAGFYNKIEKNDTDNYSVINADNHHVSHYTYEDGTPTKVEIEHHLFDFTLMKNN